ncbi:MAG: 4-hydroxy-tetrahydrodipicolinate reductase [Chitinophagales bacterium]
MKVALIGYGKMGKAIESVIAEDNAAGTFEQIDIVFRGDSKSDLLAMHGADVAIEFTSPQHAVQNIRTCFDMQIPVVSGTTGWYDALQELRSYCAEKDGALIYASNFSIGVHMFFQLNTMLAQMMSRRKGYRVRIDETHHTAKKDAPSGTAIRLAEQIMQHDPALKKWIKGASDLETDLPVYSYREEDVPGTHAILWRSEIDSIELKHTAHGRKGFAQGALEAARWIQNKKGVYTIDDMMGVQ